MKSLYAICVFVISMLCQQAVFGQERISGKVIDANTGEQLPGVAVVLEGTTKGSATDLEGNYSFELLPEEFENGTLIFSFLGYKKENIVIKGRRTIDMRLAPDQELLDEVIITAIGIEKDKRKVGYSVTEVDGEEITGSREVNIVNALNAKVAGVQITSTSGSPGASAAIRIRGNKSINGSNDPLYVIDGIPIDNSYSGSNFTDQANRAIDINPDDVESMTVLKGGAAAALYGVRAANGAIIINTKQGRAGKTEVNFSSTTTFDRVNKLPEQQIRWGQGTGGQFVEGSNASWGALLDTMRFDGNADYRFDRNGMMVSQNDPMATANRVEPYDNQNNFFTTGITLNNNLSIRGGSERSGFFLSVANLNQSGVIPLTDFNRTSVRLTANTKIRDNIDLKASANYITSTADRAQRGSNLSGVMLGLMRAPVSFDLTNGVDDPVNEESAWMFPDGTQRTFHDSYDNPFWSINKNRNEERLNRLIGFMEFNWRPFDWMVVTERFGVDTYSEQRKSYWDAQSNEFRDLGGAIFDQLTNQRNFTNDLLVTMDHQFSDDFNATLILGHAYQTFNKYFYNVDGFDFVIDGFYDMSNIASINVTADDFLDRSRNVGLIGDLSLDYQRTFYLTLTGRQDWLSNLPPQNNSFFYPSASFGWVFTEMFDLGLIEFGKLRTSYAVTGNGAFTNYLTSNYFVSGGSTQGQLSFFPNSLIGSADLRPEFSNAFEVGTDIRTKNNRVRLDLTYYNVSSTDQIVEIPIANSTGYSTFITNIGEIVNRGWEALLEVDVVDRNVNKPNRVSWTTSINFTRNRSEVVSLTDELNNIALPSVGLASTQSRVIEGYQYGVLYGSRWRRNANGDILVDENGYPLVDSENGIVGDPNPDFIAGWRNTLQYKNWTLSFLLDIRVGGDMFNGTKGVMRRLGTHIDTDERNETFVWDGVFQDTGAPNDVPISRDEQFYSRYGLTGVSEDNIETVNWVRLRDINLSYNFSPTFCKKLKITRASVTLTSRNLFLITNYTGIDPETSLGGASNAFGRDYFNNPNTRSYGVNLNVTF
jgi:TonB-linked SusC/RagA family outer membrane protein